MLLCLLFSFLLSSSFSFLCRCCFLCLFVVLVVCCSCCACCFVLLVDVVVLAVFDVLVGLAGVVGVNSAPRERYKLPDPSTVWWHERTRRRNTTIANHG